MYTLGTCSTVCIHQCFDDTLHSIRSLSGSIKLCHNTYPKSAPFEIAYWKMTAMPVLLRRWAHVCARATLQAESFTFGALHPTRTISSSQKHSLEADKDNVVAEIPKDTLPDSRPDSDITESYTQGRTGIVEKPLQPSGVQEQSEKPAKNSPQHYLNPERHRDPKFRAQPEPSQLYTGIVSRVGTMPHCIQVTRQVQVWDSFIQKYYTRPERLLVHDPSPATFLREGDVIEYGTFLQKERDDPKRWRIFEQTTKESSKIIAQKEAEDLERVRTEMQSLGIQDEKEYQAHKAKELRIQEEKGVRAAKKKKRGQNRKNIKPIRLGVSKIKGVQFVVRRIVTPFGEDIETRLANLPAQPEQSTRVQPGSRRGGQDTLLKGRGGNTSRHTARASVAGRAKVLA